MGGRQRQSCRGTLSHPTDAVNWTLPVRVRWTRGRKGDSCAEAEDGELVFEMVAETAYVKDRVSGEGMFRERVAGLVARRRSDGVRVVAG